jgi:3-methylfumaryl-CoA hydratase
MTEIDIDHLRQWIGREQQRVDTITSRLTESYAAVFNAGAGIRSGDVAPIGIHWCLSPDIAPMEALGADGHPARGGFLPPVPFPRRMWAGGKLVFSGDFRVGDEVGKRSVIEDVVLKTGRSGSLVFVVVRHEYSTAGGVVLRERQDIVYREQETPGSGAAPASPEPLLFRYSAVTFNGHRIHYDLDYVTSQEGYPGLVFHGPLQASYLLRLAAELGGAVPKEFSFRSVKPLFSGGRVTVNARKMDAEISLWVADQRGQATMHATASHSHR